MSSSEESLRPCGYKGCKSLFLKRGKFRYCSETCRYYATMYRRARRMRKLHSWYYSAPPPDQLVPPREEPERVTKICVACGKEYHPVGSPSKIERRSKCSVKCARRGWRKAPAPQS